MERFIEVNGVNTVINYDIPVDAVDFQKRISKANKSESKVVSFVAN